MVARLLRKLLTIGHKQSNKCKIGYGCSVSPQAILDADKGGAIIIGDGTEILHGVLLMTYGGNISIGTCYICRTYRFNFN